MRENPYETPLSSNDVNLRRSWSLGRIAFFAFIMLLAIPAAFSAAFLVCGVSVGAAAAGGVENPTTLILVGLIVATTTAIFLLSVIVRSAIKHFGPQKSDDASLPKVDPPSHSQPPLSGE